MNGFADQKWLDGLKAGDEVALGGGGYTSTVLIQKVARRTPGGRILLENGLWFTPQGLEYGSGKSWRRHLEPVDDALRETVFRRAACRRLESFRWAALTTESLRAVLEILARNEREAATAPREEL
jgi:hypothetical protein